MDPEMLRLAQEQMRRMSPDDLAAMQRQLMSNPDLLKFATESMKNMSAEDVRRAAQQMKQARPEDMRAMAEKFSSATPEELAAAKAQADAQVSYAMSAARTLKKQGNELHSRGKYPNAATKYKLAMDNLKNMPSSAAARALQSQCALNLMACYLKIGKFDECVREGSDVLAHDPSNVKAYYRRGQAYKELGKIEAAVADLRKASEISPEDETVAQALKDAEEKLGSTPLISDGNLRPSSSQPIVEEPEETMMNDQRTPCQPPSNVPLPIADLQETMRNAMNEPAMREMMTSMMKNLNPEMMANMSEQFGMKLSTEDAAKAQQAMSSMSLEDLDRMVIWMERARQGVEMARKVKDWILGRQGFIFAVLMLILAFILHMLGFFGR